MPSSLRGVLLLLRTLFMQVSGPIQVNCSIIISTFNRSLYLAQLLDSLVAQETSHSYEIVMIEAGSEESYRRMCAIAEPHGGVIRPYHFPGCTLGASRNFGVKQSRGEWCLFSDDDDIWHPRKVEAVLELATEFDLVSHAYVASSAPTVSEMSTLVSKGKLMKLSVCSIAWNVLGNRFGGGSSLCVRRLLAQVIVFDEGMRSCEDIEWSFRCLLSGARVGFIDQALVNYRQHGSRMTGNALRNAKWEFHFVRSLSVICLGLAVGIPLKVARLACRAVFRR